MPRRSGRLTGPRPSKQAGRLARQLGVLEGVSVEQRLVELRRCRSSISTNGG